MNFQTSDMLVFIACNEKNYSNESSHMKVMIAESVSKFESRLDNGSN